MMCKLGSKHMFKLIRHCDDLHLLISHSTSAFPASSAVNWLSFSEELFLLQNLKIKQTKYLH